MKLIFITLFTIFTSTNQEVEKLTAIYVGHSDGIFYFEDADEVEHSFELSSEKIAQKYDLTGDSNKGKEFNVTYSITTQVDEYDDEYEIYVITSLDLVE